MALIWLTLTCVASVSLRFHSKERPRKGIFGFGLAGFSVFFPALVLAPFFARSLNLVPRSLLRNRRETFATQAGFTSNCST